MNQTHMLEQIRDLEDLKRLDVINFRLYRRKFARSFFKRYHKTEGISGHHSESLNYRSLSTIASIAQG